MHKLLADENFPFPCVELLRKKGHDILTMLELKLDEQAIPDEEVLKIATDKKRAVITLNRKDFKKLHRVNQSHSGIVICKLDIDFEALAQRIHDKIVTYERLSGQLISITKS